MYSIDGNHTDSVRYASSRIFPDLQSSSRKPKYSVTRSLPSVQHVPLGATWYGLGTGAVNSGEIETLTCKALTTLEPVRSSSEKAPTFRHFKHTTEIGVAICSSNM